MDNTELLNRRIEREIAARKEAERLLEMKSLELYDVNQKLERANRALEQSLKDIEQEYRLIVERLNDVVYKIDVDGNFTFVNQAAITLLGFSSDELLGTHFTDLLDESEREEIAEFYYTQIENKKTQSYKEIPVCDVNGTIRWFGQNVSFQYDEDGVLTGGVAVARDISEIMEARQALIDSEEKYRGLIEGMELGLMEVGLDGKIIKAYDWFCDMVGYSADELRGQMADDLFLKEEDKVKMRANDAERMRGQAGVYEMEIRRKDGSFMWVAISGAPFYNNKGEIAGTVGVHLDISDQKALQAQLERANEEVKSAQDAERKFFMNMSHEIRTPLNAVVGMTHLLSKTSLNEKQEDMVQDLLYSSRMLQGLISNVLDLSKIQGGDIQPSFQAVDVSESVFKVVQIFQYVADTKKLELQADLEHVKGIVTETDLGMLNQVLLNLIGNAIKFTPNGSIRVSASLEKNDHESMLSFEVRDTGAGIPIEELDSIFDRNYRAKSSSRAEGYGLGLAITKALITILEGTIEVDSAEGKGTTVRFKIPHRNVSNRRMLADTASSDEDDSGILQETILVVEDNLMNQRYITRLLNTWGVNFIIADTVKSACQLVLNAEPSMILLDIQLPDGDGSEVAAFVRNKRLKTPIIALTASAYVGHRDHALASGIDAYVTKPFAPDELLSAMRAFNTSPSSESSEDQTYVELMRKSFLEEGPKVLIELEQAISAGNLVDQGKALHKLIAMLGLIGKNELSELCRTLEQGILNDEPDHSQIESISQLVKDTLEELKREKG